MAQRAGGHVDARDPLVRHVAAQERSVLVMRAEHGRIDKTAQRQRRMIDAGASPAEVYAAAVRETHATYLQEEPVR